MKFNKPPKSVKKVDDVNSYEQMKKAALKQKKINANINNKVENLSLQFHLINVIFSNNIANFKKKDTNGDKTKKVRKVMIKKFIIRLLNTTDVAMIYFYLE
jgi:hypothetical protein